MRINAFAVAVAVLLAVACSPQTVSKPVIGRGGGGGDRELPPATKAARSDMTRKKVNGKEAPSTLIAVDGTRCTVTEQRYREVSIGELVWCSWLR